MGGLQSQVLTFVVYKNRNNSTFPQNEAINERRIILELKKNKMVCNW